MPSPFGRCSGSCRPRARRWFSSQGPRPRRAGHSGGRARPPPEARAGARARPPPRTVGRGGGGGALTTRPFRVIAHRGASSSAPETPRAAFDRALALGARHIELDVHTTADGHVVVIHDAAVDRTTDGTGAVSGYSLAYLQN